MEQVKHLLFERDMNGGWVLRRAKNAPRWVRADLSESSDRTGIAIVHPELSDDGGIYVIADLCFDVRPSKDGINLDAILSFILELFQDYNVKVVGVSTDKYQSSFIKQAIEKTSVEYWCISVDNTKLPYQVFKSKVLNKTIKVGFYTNLLNNLKSLVEYKDKIDHTVNPKAKTKGREEDKNLGLHSKDQADGLCGATYHLLNKVGNYQVTDNYQDISRKISFRREIQNGSNITPLDKDMALQTLMGFIKTDK